MSRRPVNCPCCGSEIRRDKITGGKPFPCPSCGKLLHIPSYYYPIPGLAAVLVCALLGYVFGLRDSRLLIFVAVLWVPITAFLFAVMKLTFNPKVGAFHSDAPDLTKPPH